MEAAGLEEEHELSEKLREKHIAVTDDIEIESVNGSVHSDREPLSVISQLVNCALYSDSLIGLIHFNVSN